MTPPSSSRDPTTQHAAPVDDPSATLVNGRSRRAGPTPRTGRRPRGPSPGRDPRVQGRAGRRAAAQPARVPRPLPGPGGRLGRVPGRVGIRPERRGRDPRRRRSAGQRQHRSGGGSGGPRKCGRTADRAAAGRFPAGARDRPRRDGRRLRGGAALARPAGGGEGAAAGRRAGPRGSSSGSARGAGRGPAPPHEHRAGLRGGLRAVGALLRDAVHRGPEPGGRRPRAAPAERPRRAAGRAGSCCRCATDGSASQRIRRRESSAASRLDAAACNDGTAPRPATPRAIRSGIAASTSGGEPLDATDRPRLGLLPHGRADVAAGRRGAGLRPPARRRPPRHQARQPAARRPTATLWVTDFGLAQFYADATTA